MTTIYVVYDDDAMEAEKAYATKKPAIEHYEALREAGKFSAIRRIKIAKLPPRQLAAAIFNRSSFVDEQATIMEVE